MNNTPFAVLRTIAIVGGVAIIAPILIRILSKYLRHKYPGGKEFSQTISGVEQTPWLKKKIENYSNLQNIVSLIIWLAFNALLFLIVFNKEDASKILWIILLNIILLFSSLVPIFCAVQELFSKLFQINNTGVDPNIYLRYSSWYAPDKKYRMSRDINTAKLNRDSWIISGVVFIITLIVWIIQLL